MKGCHLPDTRKPSEVTATVLAIFADMGHWQSSPLIDRLLQDVVRLFGGKIAGYLPNDMLYHDLEHTLQATVCLCKILHGRHAAAVQPALARRDCEIALASALLHDAGYIKRADDHSGTGAKYTFVHEGRSCMFARGYLPALGFNQAEIDDVAAAIGCTGPRNRVAHVCFPRAETRVIATVLVTADYLAQMSAPDYLDKLPALYAEMEEAYEAERWPASMRQFRNAGEMLATTAAFWHDFVKPMLHDDLDGVYQFIGPDEHGANPYLAAIEANIARLPAPAAEPV